MKLEVVKAKRIVTLSSVDSNNVYILLSGVAWGFHQYSTKTNSSTVHIEDKSLEATKAQQHSSSSSSSSSGPSSLSTHSSVNTTNTSDSRQSTSSSSSSSSHSLNSSSHVRAEPVVLFTRGGVYGDLQSRLSLPYTLSLVASTTCEFAVVPKADYWKIVGQNFQTPAVAAYDHFRKLNIFAGLALLHPIPFSVRAHLVLSLLSPAFSCQGL
jgi:hypothetical protein